MENVITFCRNKCCPTVTVREDGAIVLGDANGPEGITVWTKQNFKDFIQAAKDGKFDRIAGVDTCPCGMPHSECLAGFC